jgi:hypothetical protein
MTIISNAYTDTLGRIQIFEMLQHALHEFPTEPCTKNRILTCNENLLGNKSLQLHLKLEQTASQIRFVNDDVCEHI